MVRQVLKKIVRFSAAFTFARPFGLHFSRFPHHVPPTGPTSQGGGLGCMDSTLTPGHPEPFESQGTRAAKRYVNGNIVEREKGDVWNRNYCVLIDYPSQPRCSHGLWAAKSEGRQWVDPCINLYVDHCLSHCLDHKNPTRKFIYAANTTQFKKGRCYFSVDIAPSGDGLRVTTFGPLRVTSGNPYP